MKVLYIVPSINNEGGVARVLSIKTNYLIEKLNYQVSILTQNKGNLDLFYSFNEKTELHDISLKGNRLQFLLSYIRQLNAKVKTINPDVIVVCDNGIKAYLIPWLLRTDIPLIFESHNSRFLELNEVRFGFISKLKYFYRNFGAGRFTKFVALSDYSLQEWNVNQGIVIPNPNWNDSHRTSNLSNKKAIAVGRHVYEKGYDILLKIWQRIIEKHPDWTLEIYGKSDENQTYIKLAKALGIEENVNFSEPVKDIQSKYQEASVYLMTSRFEGFPMVLVEAISSGLPCVCFDCPVGPRAIIANNENGFLVPENDHDTFYNQLLMLIENKELAKEMGENAFRSSKKYAVDAIMKQWIDLFQSVIKK